MDVTSQADAGEHHPSTPTAQTDLLHDADFASSPSTFQAANELDTGDSDERKASAKAVETAQPHEDEQQSDAEFQDFDWDGLQTSYEKEMDAQTEAEHKIQEEFDQLMAFYRVWQQIPQIQEQERCAKRLRTRIAYVEMQETNLEKQQKHHEKVMLAFKSALEMLNP